MFYVVLALLAERAMETDPRGLGRRGRPMTQSGWFTRAGDD
jgi:hypothetical protein